MFGSRRSAAVGRPLSLMLAGLLCGCAAAPTLHPSGPAPSRARAATALRGLSAQASELLDGGTAAFERRVSSLRRYPLVVNQWASWCGPCRYEFPFFQRLARRYRGRVAFLGVDSRDTRS